MGKKSEADKQSAVGAQLRQSSAGVTTRAASTSNASQKH